MGILRTVVQVPVLPMFDTGEDLPLRRAIAFQLIRADDPWHICQAFEQFAEERLRRKFISTTLH
jgi:hypothetical protein